jgi:hypothetical protein
MLKQVQVDFQCVASYFLIFWHITEQNENRIS